MRATGHRKGNVVSRPVQLQALIDAARTQPDPSTSVSFEDVRAAAESRAKAEVKTQVQVQTEVQTAKGGGVEVQERPSQLHALIEAARSQPEPQTNVLYEDVRVALQRRRWGWMAVAAVAIAVTGLGLLAWPPKAQLEDPFEQVSEQVARVQTEQRSQPSAVIPDERPPALHTVRETLVGNATVRTHDGRVSKRQGEVVLEGGHYEITTEDAPMRVQVGVRTLEISTASDVYIDASVETVTFETIRGEASWVEPRKDPKPKSTPSARELQQRAELAMQAGERAAAIDTLRVLVRRHPRSTAARVGLLDLARLEKARARPERASCAYALFLARWPEAAEAKRVREALRGLGQGAQCKGLRPVR